MEQSAAEASQPPPPYVHIDTSRRDLYDVHVPSGCGPGSPVIASLFRVLIPPFNELGVPMREGERFRVEFVPHEVTVPHGARPGSKVKTWVHRSTSHAGFEGARSFSPQLENGWLPLSGLCAQGTTLCQRVSLPARRSRSCVHRA